MKKLLCAILILSTLTSVMIPVFAAGANQEKTEKTSFRIFCGKNNEEPVKGVRIIVRNSEEKIVQRMTTNKRGYAETKKLPDGKYTIEITKISSKYVKPEKFVYNHNTKEKDKILLLYLKEVVKKPITVKGRYLSDDDYVEVKGTKYVVKNSNGKIVASLSSEKEETKPLPPDTYTITCTRVPFGFRLEERKKDVNITPLGKNIGTVWFTFEKK